MVFVKVDLPRRLVHDPALQSEGEVPYYDILAGEVGEGRLMTMCGQTMEAEGCEVPELASVMGSEGVDFQVCPGCKAALVHLAPAPVNPPFLGELENVLADYGEALQELRDEGKREGDPELDALIARCNELWQGIRWLRQMAAAHGAQFRLEPRGEGV